MRKYLIEGGFGFGSLGDELILSSELDIFGRHKCVVASYDPKETSDMHEVISIPLTYSSISNYDDYDTLIIGGGGIFSLGWCRDHYAYASNAIKKGKYVQVFNVGIMKDIENWSLVKELHLMSEKFTVRNKISQYILETFTGAKVDIDGYYSRFCKKISKMATDEIIDNAKIDKNKTLIGIQCKNVSVVIKYYIPICKYLSSLENIQLVSINTCIHKIDINNRDNIAIDIINNAIGKPVIKQITGKWFGMLHPHEMKAVLSELDILIANRKHPAICAYSEGVDVILIDNDGALREIADDIRHIGHYNELDKEPVEVISSLKNYV